MRIMSFLAFCCVSSAAFAGTPKSLKFQMIGVVDLTDGLQETLDRVDKISTVTFVRTPETPQKRSVKVIKTQDWMNMVQMNKNSVFLQVRF